MNNTSLATRPLGVSETINGFYMYVIFAFDQSVPGKTTINWTSYLGTRGGGYSHSSSSAAAELIMRITNIKGSSSASTITAVPWKSSGYYNFVNQGTSPVSSGSFDYTHDNEGEGSFSIKFDANIGGYKDSFVDATHEVTLTNNMPYTNCGAPTSVTASGIITPNGTFTVSWSGATAGVSNAIAGYDVYYRITSNGSAPDTSSDKYSGMKTVSSTSTSGSTTFTVSGATRGHKIVCGVVAKGKNYNSSPSMKTGGLVTINRLPGAPNVSVNKTIVPSTGGQVKFTVTAGTDADSQTRTLYYSTSTTGSKTKITSPWSPTINATSTYYFWTYDGMEYSSSSSSGITITKNTKPTFTVSISSQKLVSVNNPDPDNYDYTISPTITLSNISGGQSNKTYTYKLLYGVNSDVTSSKELTGLSSTATQNTIDDIRKEGIGHESDGAFYQISVRCFDGIEYSDEMKTSIRYVTKVPSLKGIYNKADFTNIDGFSEGNFATHYSKFLGFVFEKDEGYKILRFKSCLQNDQEIILNTNELDTRGSWTDSNQLESSTSYDLSYQIGYSNGGYMTLAKNKNITKIGTVQLFNFIFALKDQYYKFFTDKSTYKSTVGHSYNNSPLESEKIKEFGIKDVLGEKHFFAKIKSNGKWTDQIYFSSYEAINDNTIGFNLPTETIAESLTSLFTETQKNSAYESTFRLYIENDFGDVVYLDSDFYVDFKENDKIELSSRAIYPESSNNNLDAWQYLKEGMGKLIGNFKITSYNTNPKGEIQIKRSTEIGWQTLKTFTFLGEGEATPGNPVTYSVSNLEIQTINEISSTNYTVNYQLIVTTDAGSRALDLYSNIPVRGHIPATITIQNNSYDGTNLILGYTIINFGAETNNLILTDNKVNLYLKDQEEVKATYNNTDTEYFDTSLKTAKFENYDFAGAESNLVKLGISTTLYTYLKTDEQHDFPYFGTTKSTILDSIAPAPIFNILPTVAYRKNHLGINVLEPDIDTNAIIVIGEASGRDTIYFQSANNNNCKVVNFLIDCGNWVSQEI